VIHEQEESHAHLTWLHSWLLRYRLLEVCHGFVVRSRGAVRQGGMVTAFTGLQDLQRTSRAVSFCTRMGRCEGGSRPVALLVSGICSAVTCRSHCRCDLGAQMNSLAFISQAALSAGLLYSREQCQR